MGRAGVWLFLAFMGACAATRPVETVTVVPGPQQPAHVPKKSHTPHHLGGASDRDGDGIADSADKCPDDPEDYDDFQDWDGCPDPDNDQDGVLDVDDYCPNLPGPVSNHGCPVSKSGDRDGDGIPDNLDKCPDDPEDKDGYQDDDGCPDPDNDHDGILDVDDKCPNEAGPKSNGGCPKK